MASTQAARRSSGLTSSRPSRSGKMRLFCSQERPVRLGMPYLPLNSAVSQSISGNPLSAQLDRLKTAGTAWLIAPSVSARAPRSRASSSSVTVFPEPGSPRMSKVRLLWSKMSTILVLDGKIWLVWSGSSKTSSQGWSIASGWSCFSKSSNTAPWIDFSNTPSIQKLLTLSRRMRRPARVSVSAADKGGGCWVT